MKLIDVFLDPPRVHLDASGRIQAKLVLSKRALCFIHRTVADGARTLETGVGASTVVFALAGSWHTAITPHEAEVSRLREYCRRQGAPLGRVRFDVGYSELVLPTLSPIDLDFVLIDGSHAFPAPFIDWYYTAPLLRIGGLVMVDDTQLWTCGTLAAFLAEEPGWAHEKDLGRAVVFRKCLPFDRGRNWVHQPFTARHSFVWRRHGWRPFAPGR
jgi:hypothetical protein